MIPFLFVAGLAVATIITSRDNIILAYGATKITKNRTHDATNNNMAGSSSSVATLVHGQVTRNETKLTEDGCGLLVEDRNSSTWNKLSSNPTERSNEEIFQMEIQTCLRRIGWHKLAAGFSREGLSCGIQVDVQTVRSTLARYGTIWLHGDSIMEQQFYTLACMLNSSVDNLNPSDWPKKMEWITGLHSGMARAEGRYNESSREIFTFRHPEGGETTTTTTTVMYSRFGRKWGLTDNLYKYEFPYSIDTLTANDAILTNAAASHYASPQASEFEGAMQFIAEQSLRTNASVFVIEPTPEEWTTSNGLYAEDAYQKRGACARLDRDMILGRGKLPKTIDMNSSRVAPDLAFFERLYPDRPWEANAVVSECVPDCIPNTWRTDFVRSFLATTQHKIRLVPIYWQLVSRPTHSGRQASGDCTHRDLYATILIHYQWVRDILAGPKWQNGLR